MYLKAHVLMSKTVLLNFRARKLAFYAPKKKKKNQSGKTARCVTLTVIFVVLTL